MQSTTIWLLMVHTSSSSSTASSFCLRAETSLKLAIPENVSCGEQLPHLNNEVAHAYKVTKYSGTLYSGHLGTSTVEPSIPDTLGPVQWNPLFRTPWDQYSGTLYSGHLGTSTVEPSIPDTLGPVQWNPLFRTPWDQKGLPCILRCPHFMG